MTSSVSGTTPANLTTAQQIKDFQSGKLNITKSDLDQYVASQEASGNSVSSQVNDLVDSYDKVDLDGNGISYSELQNYNTRKQAISSCSNVDQDLVNALFNNSSGDSVQNSLLSCITGVNSNSSSSGISSNLLLSYLQSQSGTSNSSATGSSNNSAYKNLLSYLESSSGSSNYDSILNYANSSNKASDSSGSTASTNSTSDEAALAAYVAKLNNSTASSLLS